jgi:uncharacterized tellurite resistance protein B-like protein
MQTEDWTSKHDLLYMYICLGHLPDRRLGYEEVVVITERFKRWLPEIVPDEIRRIRKDVFDSYKALKHSPARYDQYVQSARNLKEFFLDKESQLIEVMEDLISIARADHAVNGFEVDLIKAAVKTWWLDLDPVGDAQAEVLHKNLEANNRKIPISSDEKEWGPDHDLLYMLVCMGHLPDREFSYEEVDAIKLVWRRRYPGMNHSKFESIRKLVSARYNRYEDAQNRYNQFLVSGQRLMEFHTGKKKHLVAILEDLFEIIRADRSIHDNEITMFETLAGIWDMEINFDLRDSQSRPKLNIKQSE